MDLPALRAVLAVAAELHFGRAAASLGIAQPQVSQRVRRLETELGLTIFERSHHRVTVTAAGREVLDAASDVVAAARRLERLAAGLREGSQGTVVIGVVGSAFFGPLAQLLEPCRERWPEIRLEVVEMESPEQVDALADGTIDLGLLRPPAPPDLDARLVWSEPLVVAVHESSPLAGRSEVAAGDLADHDVVLFGRESGPGYWDRVAGFLDAAGLTLSPVAEAAHVTTLLGLVALRTGLTLVPESVSTMRTPGVRYVPLTGGPQLDLVAVSPRGHLAPAVVRVLDAVTSRAGDDA